MYVELRSKKNNVRANGDYDKSTGILIVRAGSVVSENISNSKTFRGRKTIIEKRDGIIENCVLKENVTFNSPSTAANFVMGSSCNGLKVWKNEEGTPIGDL